jgi:hypothetical protein
VRRVTWRWPALRASVALPLLPALIGVAALQGWTLYLGSGQKGLTGVFAASGVVAWLVQPVLQTIVLNAPERRRRPAAFVAYHLGCYCAYAAVAAVCASLAQRLAAEAFHFPLGPDAGHVNWRRLLPTDVAILWYAMPVCVWSAVYAAHDRREAELRKARLEAAASKARLAALGAHLEPHFLFNALNTVSSVMYVDGDRTALLLDDLEQLLLRAFAHGEPTWSLRDERVHTMRFADFIDTRFRGRIQIAWTSPPELDDTIVPRFAVQTLVENAVKHNQTRRGSLAVRVSVDAAAGALRVLVIDDGRVFDADAPGSRSLSRLQEILRLLHGEHATLTRSNPAGGGARVEVLVPQASARGPS